MDTHEMIKKLREERGYSQHELALLVGYKDRSSIAKVEAGLVDLSRTKIEAFARVFGISPSSLIESKEPEKEEPRFSDRAITTASMFDVLDEPTQEMVFAMVKAAYESQKGQKGE